MLAGSRRDEEGNRNDARTYPIPPGARHDEIFGDVVHDGLKKIELYPDRWSKGEVLDYLFEQELAFKRTYYPRQCLRTLSELNDGSLLLQGPAEALEGELQGRAVGGECGRARDAA